MIALLHPLIAHAANATDVTIGNPLSALCADGKTCVETIMNGLAIAALPVASIMILVGAYQILFAAGSEEKVKKGKATVLYAILGYAAILLSSAVVYIISDIITKASGG